MTFCSKCIIGNCRIQCCGEFIGFVKIAFLFHGQKEVSGTGEQTVTLEKNELPDSSVGKIEILFTSTGDFSASGLRMEACAEYTGGYLHLAMPEQS